MAIPPTSGPYAILPVGRHSATFAEVYDSFVVNAPFKDERELIYDALMVYTRALKREFSQLRLWINGGFVTHKPWAAPNDTDVAVVVPQAEYSNMLSNPGIFTYLTLQNVLVPVNPIQSLRVPRLQPMAGLIDGFIVADDPAQTAVWDYEWSRVRDRNKNEVPNLKKGYLEVTP